MAAVRCQSASSSDDTGQLTDGRHDEQPDDDDSDDDFALKLGGTWALGQAAAQHQHHAGDHAACTAPGSLTAPYHRLQLKKCIVSLFMCLSL